jgi:AcrR family transcriptional regulator
LPPRSQTPLEPRKRPVQARSTVSVNAILEATVQVLLDVGKERLTTTKVALRAGVSVGTLYQYFPNKSALLQAALRSHFDEVCSTLERVCRQERTKPLKEMAAAVISTFLEAKMKDLKTSVALHAVSSDVDGLKIAREIGGRVNKAVVSLLESSDEHLSKDPQIIASVIQGAMSGVARRLLDSSSPEKQFEPLRQELILMVSAYLDSCSVAKLREVS